MKILLFIPNGLGDVLMSIPAITSILIKQQEFMVVVQNKTQSSILRHKFGSKLQIIERFDGGKFSQIRLLLKIRKFNPSVIYAPLVSNKLLNIIFFWLTTSRVYFPGIIKRKFLNIHYQQYNLSTYDGHQVNYILDFLDQFKNRSYVDPGALFIKSDVVADFVTPTSEAGVRLALGLSCGERERHKIPRPQFFSNVVNKLSSVVSDDISVFVFGAGNDILLIREFILQLDPRIRVVQLLNAPLEKVFFELSKCHIGIAGTTGQGHMMAAVNLPMVVLAGVTNPAESGPYTLIQKVISHNYECGPCYSVNNTQGCGYPCMDDLNPDLAAYKLVELLNYKK